MSTGLTPAVKRQNDLKRDLRSLLEKGKEEFAMVLPSHMTPDRMIRIALTACTIQPKLLDCTKESVALALLTASQTGLEPDGYHGHLIPYGRVCQFIPDYKGLVQLALENGVIIDGYVVHEKDDFAYQLGTEPCIHHVPSDDADRGPLRCAYAVAKFPNGRVKFVVATRNDVERRKKASKSSSGADSPWRQWESEMWIKSAVKMLMKFVPRSHNLKLALMADDVAEQGMVQTPLGHGLPIEVKSSKTEAIASRIAGDVTDDLDTSPQPDPVAEAATDEVPAEEVAVDNHEIPAGLSAYMDALTMVSTEPDVRQLFREMIHTNKKTLGKEAYDQAVQATQSRIIEIQGGA